MPKWSFDFIFILFYFNFNSFWLGFKYYNSLKSICRAPGALIEKRGLICDHCKLVNIKVYLDECLFTFEKIFVVKIDAIDFRKLKFNFQNILLFNTSSWNSLKSICRPPVSLIDERTLICDHIK
jgi:hypothetical protein